mgnify:CR=1 FL=1
MVTDEIQKVTELEQEVKQKKENAAAQNKQRVSQAQRAARLAVEQARHDGRGRGPGAGLGAGRSGTGPAGLRGPQGADAQPAG